MQYSPKIIKDLLDKHEFKFKKNYGQNFIIDENIIDNIINKADIDSETLVIEIGPGAGALTQKLSNVAKNVLCYEIDSSLSQVLNEVLKDNCNVEIIYKDFLKCNIKIDLERYNYKKLYVVANLPYYITTPIIVKLIEDNISVDKIIVMVQKEVGYRFSAKPGTKDYSSLSIFLNYYFDVKKIMNVSRNVFIPKPNVDSIIIQFNKKNKLPYLKNKEIFFELVRDSFKQKRKTLKNNLSKYNLEKIDKVLVKHNMNLKVRAEQIPLEVFIELANNL